MSLEIITQTVGSAIVSFLVEKSLMSAARIPKWLRKRPSAFKSFDEGETTVVLSSLYPKSAEDFVIKPIRVVSGDNVEALRVRPPAPLTGIRDSFGLANLVVTLFRLKANFILRVDPISDTEKENNLIVFGSPTSNLVAKEFYETHIPSAANFEFALPKYDKLIFEGVPYEGGQFAVIIKYRNPWNNQRHFLSLAGIGPVGTEAAVIFAVRGFDSKKVPEEVRESNYWITIVEGILRDGYVTEVRYREGKRII